MVLLSAAVLLTTLAACGNGLTRPHAAGTTVIVVGDRANMPAPSLTDTAMTLISDSVQSKDEIYLVNVSGSPQVVGHLSTQSDCDSKSACAGVWKAFEVDVQNAIRKVPATAPQADLLSALSIAGRQLANARGPKHILVIDSGLQTVGALPLQAPGVLDVDPSTITASLKANGTLPDLHGVDVLMTGLGSTYSPQQPVREPYRTRLVNLWEAVVTASSGNFTPRDDTQLPDIAPARDLPDVTTVTFRQQPPPPPTTCDYQLRADQIGFVRERGNVHRFTTNAGRAGAARHTAHPEGHLGNADRDDGRAGNRPELARTPLPEACARGASGAHRARSAGRSHRPGRGRRYELRELREGHRQPGPVDRSTGHRQPASDRQRNGLSGAYLTSVSVGARPHSSPGGDSSSFAASIRRTRRKRSCRSAVIASGSAPASMAADRAARSASFT